MFLGFLFGARVDVLAKRAEVAYPGSWGATLLPAPTFMDRHAHLPRLDVAGIREALRRRAPDIRAAVVFAVDSRPKDLADLRRDLVYTLPRVEIIELVSKRLETTLTPLLEYYAMLQTDRPRNLADALRMFSERHPDVVILPRATRSADVAGAFLEPRLALTSLHFLPRVYVDWQDARRADQTRSNHADLQDLRYPARQAFRELISDARFDVSDTASPSPRWLCSDGAHRDFGWHQKWSLASQRTIENHCRIHYSVDRGSATIPTRVFIGHCGEHL